jgi:hypothetical protein
MMTDQFDFPIVKNKKERYLQDFKFEQIPKFSRKVSLEIIVIQIPFYKGQHRNKKVIYNTIERENKRSGECILHTKKRGKTVFPVRQEYGLSTSY